VVLPERWRQWPEAELDAVLTHEREHARRRDPLVQWLAALTRSVFWFHPLAWWLERKLAALAEEACDAAALARGHDPRDYSLYLIEQARAIRKVGARLLPWAPAIDGAALSARIQRLLSGPPAPRVTRRHGLAAGALCTLAITCAPQKVRTMTKSRHGNVL
jgi:beta-lactamase regulating signal transducer with metallopeptidase domain